MLVKFSQSCMAKLQFPVLVSALVLLRQTSPSESPVQHLLQSFALLRLWLPGSLQYFYDSTKTCITILSKHIYNEQNKERQRGTQTEDRNSTRLPLKK